MSYCISIFSLNYDMITVQNCLFNLLKSLQRKFSQFKCMPSPKWSDAINTYWLWSDATAPVGYAITTSLIHATSKWTVYLLFLPVSIFLSFHRELGWKDEHWISELIHTHQKLLHNLNMNNTFTIIINCYQFIHT